MPFMRRVAALGAAVAAARRFARSNPDKVNKYADQAAAFVDRKTQGKYRKQIDSAVRQVHKETGGPRSVRGQGGYGTHPGQGPQPGRGGQPGQGGHGQGGYGTHPGQGGHGPDDGPTRSYPSYREDRPR